MASALADPDRRIAIRYADPSMREALAALWRLDEVLGRTVAHSRDTMIAQMKLTWWFEALSQLNAITFAVDPVLVTLRSHLLHHGIDSRQLAELVIGWEAVLDPLPLPDTSLLSHALHRGAALFDLTCRLMDVTCLSRWGDVWALNDFARHCTDTETVERARGIARARVTSSAGAPKPLKILYKFACIDLNRPAPKMRSERSRLDIVRAVI